MKFDISLREYESCTIIVVYASVVMEIFDV